VWSLAAGAAVTPSDATLYDPPLRLLYCGGAGNLVLVLDSNDETDADHRFTVAVTAGQLLDVFAIKQVRAASTATGLLGFT
jgi:hypothetical protein